MTIDEPELAQRTTEALHWWHETRGCGFQPHRALVELYAAERELMRLRAILYADGAPALPSIEPTCGHGYGYGGCVICGDDRDAYREPGR